MVLSIALLLDPGAASAQTAQSKFAEVNGVKLHYLIAGKGNLPKNSVDVRPRDDRRI
jgi:hypothetical protein